MEMNELRLLQKLGDKLDKLIEMLDKERNQAAHEKKFYLKSALFGLLGVFLGLLVDFILFG